MISEPFARSCLLQREETKLIKHFYYYVGKKMLYAVFFPRFAIMQQDLLCFNITIMMDIKKNKIVF